jgi:hypothetical protein
MAITNRSPWMMTYSSQGTGIRLNIDQRFTCGNIFFVQSTNSNAGDTVGRGQTPDAPFSSINYAVTQCTADNGDVVIVLPGHVETVTAAGGCTIGTAGVTVLGVGSGRQRPKVNYTTAAAASFDITAARVCVDNLYFTGTGVASVTNMVNVKTAAADCTIRNCEFEHANATNQAANVILTDATADRLRVENCHFHGSANAGTNSAISLVGGNEIRITDCQILGNYHASNGVILNSTTDCLNLFVARNSIINRTASSTKCLVFTSSSTGAVVTNDFGILSGTAPITGAAIDLVSRNYYKAAVGVAAGTLI